MNAQAITAVGSPGDHMPTKTSSYGLTRYVYQYTCGWLARYYSQRGPIQKLFSDSRYAYDPEASRQAAAAWLLRIASATPPVSRHASGRSPRNTTGYVGISLTEKVERNGASFWVYQVSWAESGRRRAKSFRIHLFPSRRAALEAARAFREERERQMDWERARHLQQVLATQATRRHTEYAPTPEEVPHDA